MYDTPRKVKFSTKLNALKRRPLLVLLGSSFTFSGLLFLIIISALSSFWEEEETPKIDYELINSQGKEITAEVTGIETQNNVTIRGVHPTIISYKYAKSGEQVYSQYSVLEDRKIEGLKIGDNLTIKELNGSSIIKDLKPYNNSSIILLVLIAPVIILIIGLLILSYVIADLRKELKLYKLGTVAKGKIISLMPKSGLSTLLNFGQGIIVHYEYKLKNGDKIIRESFTSDFSIMTDKKKDDFIPIFVSPKDEKKSCVVSKLQSLRNNWNIDFT